MMDRKNYTVLDHHLGYIQLLKWMKFHGYKRRKKLRPSEFQDTGRGILAGEKIEKNECIISIPKKLLITTTTALNSELGIFIREWSSKLSAQQILALFLVFEKKKKSSSFWYPYFQVLPSHYSVPSFWENIPTNSPSDLKMLINEQRKFLEESFVEVSHFLDFARTHSQQTFSHVMTLEEFLWGWFTVHSRAVYYQQPPNPHLKMKKNCYALAPFLDLFNHSPHSKVEAAFNETTQSYEITSFTSYRKHEQVFINYGPHDNLKLVVDYGFCVLGNPFSSVNFSKDEIMHAVLRIRRNEDIVQNLRILESQDLLRSLWCAFSGASWNLKTVIHVLLLHPKELKEWFSHISNSNSTTMKEVNEVLRICLEKKLLTSMTDDTVVKRMVKSSHVEEQLVGAILQEEIAILKNTINSM